MPKLFILPVVLTILRFKDFSFENLHVLNIYLALILVGLTFGFIFGIKTNIKVLKKFMSIETPGSYQILFLLMLIFLIKYAFGFLNAVKPNIAVEYSILEISIDALFSGYFFGRSLSFLKKYLKHNFSD